MGVFDFAHDGHRALLAHAAQKCDKLIVAVHTDAWCRSCKTILPANSELERLHAVQAFGIADQVVLLSDRNELCQRFSITHIFHGDDWSLDEMREHWGRLLDRYRLQTVLLPHTDGISSTELRQRVPRIGWWLHPIPAHILEGLHGTDESTLRLHIFDALRGLYRELGGTWILFESDRARIRKEFPSAPCVLLQTCDLPAIVRQIASFDYDILVTSQLNIFPLATELAECGSKVQLVVLPHGRSGKKVTQKSFGPAHAPRYLQRDKPLVEQCFEVKTAAGPFPLFDWRSANDSYTHLDDFLARGGQFENAAPSTERPRILLLPTWGPYAHDKGLLLAPRWHAAVAELTRDHEVWLAPHPLCRKRMLETFVTHTGVTLLEATGRSFELVPQVHCAIADLSGAFFEALLFDTPVVFAESCTASTWPDDYSPTRRDLEAAIPFATPETLATLVRQQIGKRKPQQHTLATKRLGTIDGSATQHVAAALRELLARSEQRRRLAQLLQETQPPG